MKVDGRIAVLTGATGGIGAAVARELARRRARLVLVARDEVRASCLAAELGTMGTAAHVLIGDMLDPALPGRLVEFAERRAGGIDLLINCAGRQSFGFFADESARAAEEVFQVNTIAPITLINAVLPGMLRRGHGQIVNVGSIFGSIGFPCFATYSASKFALRGFSEALRRELAGTGVVVTHVAPRFTRTPFNDGAVAAMAAALGMNQDEPEAVARALVDAIERDGQNRYLGWPEKLFVRVNALLPRIVDGALMRQVEKMRPFAARDAETADSLR